MSGPARLLDSKQQQGPPSGAAKICPSSFFRQSSVSSPKTSSDNEHHSGRRRGFDEWSNGGVSMTEHHEWSRHTARAGLHTNSHTRPITDIIVAVQHLCFTDHNVLNLRSRARSAVGTELSSVTIVCRIVRRLPVSCEQTSCRCPHCLYYLHPLPAMLNVIAVKKCLTVKTI